MNHIEIVLDNNTSILYKTFASRDSLMEYSKLHPNSHNLLVKQDLWHEVREGVALSIHCDSDLVSEVLFGVTQSLLPVSLAIWNEAKMVLCAIDRGIVMISWVSASVLFRNIVGACIEILRSSDGRYMLVLDEAYLYCYDQSGNEIWAWTPSASGMDSVGNIIIEDGLVRVYDAEGSKTECLDSHTGKICKF